MSNVFDHAWYGGLFGDPEVAAIFTPSEELDRMRKIEIAWVRTQASSGQLDQSTCESAVNHIAHCPIDFQILRDGTAIDGLPIPAFVRALKAEAPSVTKMAIHAGLTSQDVIDTSLMLALQPVLALLQTRLTTLHTALQDVFARDAENTLMGYTRMQPALPIKAGIRIASWSRPLDGYIQEIIQLATTLRIIQWGGPVGARNTDSADSIGASFAEKLGLRDPGYAWHSNRSDIAALGGLAARVSGSLGKIGQDVALMAQLGKSEVTLKTGGTSSAMPHKQNPIPAELLVTLARFNASQLSNLNIAIVHEQERSGTAWALEWMCLPDMLQCCGSSLIAASRLLEQIGRIGTPAN